jgi:Asp-tRNA(Asn)/Glu-tRNA(Gln) amidotransferase A subunit family amidase
VNTEYEHLSAGEIAMLVRRGELRAEDYAVKALERYRAQRHLNAVAWIDETHLQDAAGRIDQRRARGEDLGPLAGVPVIIKDNIDVAGVPTAAGTPALRRNVAQQDAMIVQRLRECDAILFGKANMHELALGCTSSNLATGVVRNPHDPSRIPGGSSGGTAAAIAAGIVPAGLGTDTAGSVRIPSALCGIAGLRPATLGDTRYHPLGGVPLASALDAVGPMARTVDDVALLHRALMRSPEVQLPSLRQTRLGVPRRFYWTNLQAEVASVAEDALSRLRAAGAELVDVDVGDYYRLASEAYTTYIMHGLNTDLRDYLERTGFAFDGVLGQVAGADVKAMFERAAHAGVSQAQAAKAREIVLGKALPRYYEMFRANGIAALVFPTVPIAAPLIREQGDRLDDVVEIEGKFGNAVLTLVRNTHVTAVMGTPGLSVPAGLTRSGLPVGLELDGLPGHDDSLLALGMSVERALGLLPPLRAAMSP